MIDKKVVFLHIPKTGGTTLNYILQTVYKWQFLWLRNDILSQESKHITPIELFLRIPERNRKNFKAIAGHQICRALDYYPNCFSVFVARNPIHHVPSYFFHHKRHKSDSPSNKLVRSYNYFDKFLVSESDYYPNPQSKSLFCDEPETFENPEMAKEKIRDFVWNEVSLCGPTDKLDLLIQALASQLCWGNIGFTNKNIGKYNNSLSHYQKKLIIKNNELDCYLYEQVSLRFEKIRKDQQLWKTPTIKRETSILDKIILRFQQFQLARLAKVTLKKEVKFFIWFAIVKKIKRL